MSSSNNKIITVEVVLNAAIDQVWECWTLPEHITQWNNASPDWYTPQAQNDLQEGGSFSFRMEARDGSAGFDFNGIYDKVILNERISYTIADGRKVDIVFAAENNQTTISESFEAEDINSLDMQKEGWQSILNNFKAYVEALI